VDFEINGFVGTRGLDDDFLDQVADAPVRFLPVFVVGGSEGSA
jgi:hypothetical protein